MKPLKFEPRAWKRILLGVGIGIAVLVAGVSGLIWSLSEQQAHYEGKTFWFWLEDSKSQDAAVSNRAVMILSTQVLPQLTNQLFCDTNDSRLRMALVDRLNSLLEVNLTYVPAVFRRAGAAGQLGKLGSRGVVAIPALLRVLKTDDAAVRARAAESLGEIHAEPTAVIPALVEALNDHSAEVRTAAAGALAGWGKEAQAAVPRLVQLLDDRSDRDLMATVREALKEIDPEAAANAALK